MNNHIRVAVLAGGTSDERAVSLQSGMVVCEKLTDAGYSTNLVDITDTDLSGYNLNTYDVAFPVLHGKFGEDGAIQKQLEALNIRYVGSDSAASSLCFDKDIYRKFLATQGIPLPVGNLVNEIAFWDSELSKKPFVLKPFDGGSSIDMLIIHDPSQLSKDTVSDVFTRHEQLLLEELIEGVEITVGVLDSNALPVIEIIPPEGKEFDYENKYNGATQELCPPKNLSQEVQQAAQQLAAQIHHLTNCRHYSRTDMIVRPDDSLVVLETNTLPGMTNESLFPKAASVSGLPMEQLVDTLVQLALR
jgi:D-alanine--D-alanine ligase